MRPTLEGEGIALLVEGVQGSITYRRYRSPKRRASYRRIGIRGGVAVTRQRLLVWSMGNPQINVERSDPRLADIEITLDKPDRVCFAFDAGTFDPQSSGTIEIRLDVVDAAGVPQALGRAVMPRGET
jgi:hypothetical protein